MPIRQQIMELPAQEQLPAALALLEELTASSPTRQHYLSQTFGLSPKVASLFGFLLQNPQVVLPKQRLLSALYGYSDDTPEEKIIDVFLCQLRRKLPEGIQIQTVWGQGVTLVATQERIDEILPPMVNPGLEELPQFHRRRTEWSSEDDNTLRQMRETGSTLSAMSEELDRTERAVRERIRHLGLNK